MPAQFIAVLAAVSYALFTVCGWFGRSMPAHGWLRQFRASRTIMLWLTTVIFTGGIPQFAPNALWVFVGLGILQSAISLLTFVGLRKLVLLGARRYPMLIRCGVR